MTTFELLTSIISTLAIIISIGSACFTRKQYRGGIKPDLWTNGQRFNPVNEQVGFEINNRGPIARINKIKVLSNNLVLNPTPYPIDIASDDSAWIWFQYNGAGYLNTDSYKIKIYYSDRDKNSYSAILEHVSGNCFIK